ncbi:hypothetical protein ACFVFQ_14505 [Streptomyces sp. NPDC057743]|uniref:hypothetical protein n=1 Tax=Streptomyces sp. NPDC057743 TaxID=3346236 RepID=UPI0036970AD2
MRLGDLDQGGDVLADLLYTTPYEINVSLRDTRIEWTAGPAPFLGLAHREAAELPACVEKFTPRPKAAMPH